MSYILLHYWFFLIQIPSYLSSFLLRIFYGVLFNTWIKLTFEASVHLCSFCLCTLHMSLLTPWKIWHSTQIQNKSIFKIFSWELQEVPLKPFLIFENGVLNSIFIYSVSPHDTCGLWPVVEAHRNIKQILLKLYLLYHRHCHPSLHERSHLFPTLAPKSSAQSSKECYLFCQNQW